MLLGCRSMMTAWGNCVPMHHARCATPSPVAAYRLLEELAHFRSAVRAGVDVDLVAAAHDAVSRGRRAGRAPPASRGHLLSVAMLEVLRRSHAAETPAHHDSDARTQCLTLIHAAVPRR
jgi:hypothetical protein